MPPQLSRVEVERADLDFRSPHAVVAVVRGVAWEGVSLVRAWVTGPNHDDFDWEALEIDTDTDTEPAEAEAPWAYAEQIRVRGDRETS